MRDQRISSYLVLHEPERASLPWLRVVESTLRFASEIVVADATSRDGTWEALLEVAREERRVRLLRFPLERTDPGWALKLEVGLRAAARSACRGAYCFEANPDEVVGEADAARLQDLLPGLTRELPVIALPLLEYWSGTELLRRDLLPAAPRLSLNLPTITHGIPREQLRTDADGEYAEPYASLSGTYVDRLTGAAVPCRSLYPLELEELREHPAYPDTFAASFHRALEGVPCIRRLTWLDLPRAVRRLRDSQAPLEQALYRLAGKPLASPFAAKPWEDLTDAECDAIARRLANEGPAELTGFAEQATIPARLQARAPAVR